MILTKKEARYKRGGISPATEAVGEDPGIAMKKKFVAILATVCILTAGGCGKTGINREEKTVTHGTETVESAINEKSGVKTESGSESGAANSGEGRIYSDKKSYQTAADVVRCMEEEDYASLLALMHLPEDAAVTPDSLARELKQSEWRDFLGNELDIVDFAEYGRSVNATVASGDKCGELRLTADEDGEYVPVFYGLGITASYTPGGSGRTNASGPVSRGAGREI